MNSKRKIPQVCNPYPLKEGISHGISPSDATVVDQEIARLKAIDDERERVHKKKMKGIDFLSVPERI